MIKKFYHADAEGYGGENATPPKEEMQENLQPGEELDQAIVEEKNGPMIHQRIREMRTAIDGLYLTANLLGNYPHFKSREMSLAVTHFQFARQFTGKVLAEKGGSNSYPKDGSAKRTDAGQVIDIWELMPVFESTHSETDEEVKQTAIRVLVKFRDAVEDVITDISVYAENSPMGNITEYACVTGMIQDVLRGKHMLGELLAMINSK